MSKYEGKGITYKEVIDDVKQYLEHPPMIALPGGTWCVFCNAEMCRTMRHCDRQLLNLVIARLAKQIEDLNKQLEVAEEKAWKYKECSK